MSVRKPRIRDGSMRFGLFWPKAATMLPSRKMAQRNPNVLDLDNHLALARVCEEVGLDLVLLGDGYAPSSDEGSSFGFQDPSLHALVLAAPLIQATTHLGVISTLHVPFFAPVQIARFGSHFDWLSGGRWGWNVVNGYRDYEARLFGIEQMLDGPTQYEAADEALHIITSVWRDKGIVDFSGKHLRASGKMRGPFPLEKPALVCAAASERGRRFTAEHCDYLFASPPTLAALPEVRASLARHAGAAERDTPEILVVADVLVRDRPDEAADLMQELMSDIGGDAGDRWAAQMALLRKDSTSPGRFPTFAGTPNEVAQQILSAREQWGLNGILFRLPLWAPEEMARVGPVLALLEDAGVWVAPERRSYCW